MGGARNGTSIELSWTLNSANERFIAIERKPTAENTYRVIAIVGAGVESFSDGGVDSDSYDYRIMAFGSLGGAGYSNEVTVD